MVCRTELTISPPNELDGHFGTCLPPENLECASEKCPASLACVFGEGASSKGSCTVPCRTHGDCGGPYQICDGLLCAFLRCPFTSEADAGAPNCPQDTTCLRGMCLSNVNR